MACSHSTTFTFIGKVLLSLSIISLSIMSTAKIWQICSNIPMKEVIILTKMMMQTVLHRVILETLPKGLLAHLKHTLPSNTFSPSHTLPTPFLTVFICILTADLLYHFQPLKPPWTLLDSPHSSFRSQTLFCAFYPPELFQPLPSPSQTFPSLAFTFSDFLLHLERSKTLFSTFFTILDIQKLS